MKATTGVALPAFSKRAANPGLALRPPTMVAGVARQRGTLQVVFEQPAEKHEIQQAVTILEHNMGSSERLLTSPIPVFYSRHLLRFLFAWLVLLPFAKLW